MHEYFSRLLFGFMVLALAGCGGGGGSPGSMPVTSAPAAIRFVGNYDGQQNLTIAPLAGATSLGSAPIAKVELNLDQGRSVQVLTAPNGTIASGQATYVFPVTAGSGQFIFHCGVTVFFQVTVTDVNGFSYTKYTSGCSGINFVFGAFSDYGDRDVVLQAGGSPATTTFNHYGAGGYADVGKSPEASPSWTLRVQPGDSLSIFSQFAATAPVGSTLTASITTGADSAVSFASSNGDNFTTAQAALQCCAVTVAPAGSHTVTFTASVSRDVVVGSGPGPIAFDVHYRIFDPLLNRVVTESSAAVQDGNSWTFNVPDGQQLTLDAGPQSIHDLARISISSTSNGSASELASAWSNLPGSRARLAVTCCAR